MEAMFKQCLLMSLLGSLLYIGTRLILAFLGKRLTAREQYDMLLAVLMSFMLPFGKWINDILAATKIAPLGLGGVTPTNPPYLPAVSSEILVISPAIQTASVGQNPISTNFLINALLIMWIAGALIRLSYEGSHILRFHKFLQQHSRLCKDSRLLSILDSEKSALKIRQSIALYTCDAVLPPFITRVWHYRIVLPENEHQFSDEEVALLFRHELIHLRQGHLWQKWLMLVGGILHWFNPLWHLYVRDMSLHAELACDARLIQKMGRNDRHLYGQILIKASAPHPRITTFASLSRPGKQLKERLAFIAVQASISRRIRLFARTAFCAFLLLSLMVACIFQSRALPVSHNPASTASVQKETKILPSRENIETATSTIPAQETMPTSITTVGQTNTTATKSTNHETAPAKTNQTTYQTAASPQAQQNMAVYSEVITIPEGYRKGDGSPDSYTFVVTSLNTTTTTKATTQRTTYTVPNIPSNFITNKTKNHNAFPSQP